MMLRMQMPAEAGNAAIKDGRFAKVLSEMMERVKPEAAYFTSFEGDRCAFIVFDMQHPSDIPSIVEPFFDAVHAKVELQPVMTAEDVQAGLARANST
jgi:hypothetical protein